MKTAIIIVGQFRQFEKCKVKILKHLIKNSDIFISTDNWDNYDILKKFFGDKLKDFCVKNDFEFKKELYSKPDKSHTELNAHINKHGSFENYMMNSSYQHWRFKIGLNSVIDYEKKNNIKYEWIMKIRFDILPEVDFGPWENADVFFSKYIKKKHSKLGEDHFDGVGRITSSYKSVTKYLGGPFIYNKKSFKFFFDKSNKERYNKTLFTYSDFVFYCKRNIMLKLFNDEDGIHLTYGSYKPNMNCELIWWSPEGQFFLSILKKGYYYLDLQIEDKIIIMR